MLSVTMYANQSVQVGPHIVTCLQVDPVTGQVILECTEQETGKPLTKAKLGSYRVDPSELPVGDHAKITLTRVMTSPSKAPQGRLVVHSEQKLEVGRPYWRPRHMQ